jgi:NAD(P) transhydrogenase subunit alpha
VIGAGDLAVQVPVTASLAYAHNAVALLTHLTRGGSLVLDPADPVQDAMLVTHQRAVRHSGTWELLLAETAVAGLP